MEGNSNTPWIIGFESGSKKDSFLLEILGLKVDPLSVGHTVQRQTYQIFINDDQMLILCLTYFITTVKSQTNL
jgi:hypothetical protein